MKQGYAPQPTPVVQPSKRIASLMRRLDKGEISELYFKTAMRGLLSELQEKASVQEANRLMKDRVRGSDFVQEKLLAARRKGELDDQTVELALWALRKNPAIAEGLGISIRGQNENGTAGQYNPAARIITLFSGNENLGTALHEILHHTERMMPAEAQAGITSEWAKAIKAASEKATPAQREAMAQMLEATAGSQAAYKQVRKAFADGVLDYDQHYQLVNPSEFWAVNATRIMQSRFEANSWQAKAKQWLGEFLEKIKALLKMRSDAPILKALDAVMRGDGEFISKAMLTDAKTVDQPAYHGTPYRGIEKFSTDKIGTGEGAQAYGWGLYFASKREIAEYYRETLTNRDMQGYATAHLNAKNLVARLNGDAEWAAETLTDQIANTDPSDPNYKRLADTLEMVKSGAYAKPLENPGQLYEVEIPEDSEMLLWDKPLSEQPEKVRKVLEDLLPGPQVELPTGYRVVEKFASGRTMYQPVSPSNSPMTNTLFKTEAQAKAHALDILNEFRLLPTTKGAHVYGMVDQDPAIASDMLLRSGIKGIKYLDGTSRNAGDGSYNYVIFSGDDVQIRDQFYDISKPKGAPSPREAAELEKARRSIAAKSVASIGKVLSAYSAGRLSAWDKTVGTPYNLAQKSPQFKRVFDGLNDFINDTSAYANAAASLATTWLPELKSIKDLGKTPVSAADSDAVSQPIFEGTTIWTRDAGGKPVKMDEVLKRAQAMNAADKAQALLRGGHLSAKVLKMWQGQEVDAFEKLVSGKYERDVLVPGIVFTDAELKSIYGLTPKQIDLYKQFRSATDKSLEDMTVTAMLRVGGKNTEDMRESVSQMSMDDAAEALRDRMYELAKIETNEAKKAELDAAGDQMIDLADKIGNLKRRGYAPLMRFGDRTLTVTGKDGEMLYFGMYETGMERYRARKKLEEQFPDAEITSGTVSKEEFKMFAGISPETLELFGDVMGDKLGFDTSSPVYQEYLRKAKANQSGMKRLLKRKGTAGYREEPARVLASFIYSNARQASRNLNSGRVAEAINEIDKGQGELKDYAIKLDEYIRNPQEEAQAIRGLLFVNFIGGSMASALVNLAQPFQVTTPWLARHDVAAGAKLSKALALMWRDKTGNAELDRAIAEAERIGILDPQEVFHLMAQARGASQLRAGKSPIGHVAAVANNSLSRLMVLWGAPFSLAEAFNRRLTFVAAVLVAQDKGIANPVKFGEQAIAETQFIYNKVNNPRWARGPIGAPLFTFKKFGISWIETFGRMASSGPEGKAAAILMLAMLVLMAGIEGLPFREDIEDLIDGFAGRVLDREFQAKAWRRKLLEDAIGETWANFVNSGISGLPGAPLDVSGRLGMHNLIPGTGALVKKKDYGNDMFEVAGAFGGLLKQYGEAASLAVEGNLKQASIKALPVAGQNVAKGVDMAMTGTYRDSRGNVVSSVSTSEAVGKGIGFQPRSVAELQSSTFMQQRRIAQVRMAESEMVDQAASAIFLEGLKAKKEGRVFNVNEESLKTLPGYVEAMERLELWNKNNPDSPIKIEPRQLISKIKSMSTEKAERIIKQAPREMRGSVAEGINGK